MRSDFKVTVNKDYLVFSSAHFITFRGHQCEALHGHNYRVGVTVEGNVLHVARDSEQRKVRALHGLTRKLIANMAQGVSQGFNRVLDINGVGYRAEVKGQEIHMTLGYSHPVVFLLPPGVVASVERQVIITLSGADRQLIGEMAAKIRSLRPPEPYKGKGIKYREEFIKRKAGKAVGSAGGK